MLTGLALGLALITAAEWIFKSFEIRSSQYVAIAGYIEKDPEDHRFRTLVATALQDGEITSREHKPLVEYILDREGRYEFRGDVEQTRVEARQRVLRQLET